MKEKQKIIRLKNARKVFKSVVTRMRPHDLIVMSVDKKSLLSPKEQEELQTIAMEFKNGFFGEKCDLLVTRTKDKLKFVKF